MSDTQTESQAPSPLDGWNPAQLVTRFQPDPDVPKFQTISDATAAGHDTLNPITGFFQVAVVVDGAPVVVIEEQAAHVRHLADAANKASQAKQGG